MLTKFLILLNRDDFVLLFVNITFSCACLLKKFFVLEHSQTLFLHIILDFLLSNITFLILDSESQKVKSNLLKNKKKLKIKSFLLKILLKGLNLIIKILCILDSLNK